MVGIGICRACGVCCRTMILSGGDELTRLRSAYVKDVEHDGKTYIIMDLPCKYLDENNKCTIHDKPDYPERCRLFPRGEEELWKKVHPRCGLV